MYVLWAILAARYVLVEPVDSVSRPGPTPTTDTTLASPTGNNGTTAAVPLPENAVAQPQEKFFHICVAMCGSAAVTRALSPRTVYALWAVLAARQAFAETSDAFSPPGAMLDATTTALATTTKTCAGFLGPQDCPASTTAAVISASYTSNPDGATILVPGSGAVLLHRFNSRTFYIPGALLFAQHVLAEPAKQVSIPLPELAVNTSTTASVTVTQLVFVQSPDVPFTPTVTEYIALCTPYCARFDKQGRCTKIEGCGTTATSGSVETLASSPTLGICMVAMFAVGLLVGRLRRI